MKNYCWINIISRDLHHLSRDNREIYLFFVPFFHASFVSFLKNYLSQIKFKLIGILILYHDLSTLVSIVIEQNSGQFKNQHNRHHILVIPFFFFPRIFRFFFRKELSVASQVQSNRILACIYRVIIAIIYCDSSFLFLQKIIFHESSANQFLAHWIITIHRQHEHLSRVIE